jgi:septum formation protein
MCLAARTGAYRSQCKVTVEFMTPPPDLYLASASPRRRELLAQIGIQFETLAVTVEEWRAANETPLAYVQRVALAKAQAGWAELGARVPRPVLGADTEVVLDGEVLGKPQDRDHGLAMLARLSGRTHEVLSAVAIVTGERVLTRLSRSSVSFRVMTAAQCAAYWATGEPLGKAGGYAIQGRGALFVTDLHGSYSGVMGLPLCETGELLRELGIELLGAIR